MGEIPFSSERKLMSTLEADLEDEGPVAVVTKGAPDVLLARCTSERVAGKVRPLTDARRADVMATVDRQPRALGRRGQEGVRASGQIAGPPTCGRLNP